ncbi:TetR-like C-terminal domain-containing protein, partial [Lysinibacillus sp. D3C2_S12]|uniref:TetR-like C-terminal domain-containing protein n=1 Tax=Lysinibacillus sp. D3C2_S12 TaxID=2941226 RepID=UPI0020BD514F
RLPVPDTGSAYADILIHATNLTKFLTSREVTIIKQLLGEGQSDSRLADAYRDRYFRARRLEARSLLEKGVLRGELKKNIDIDICIDLIYRPI